MVFGATVKANSYGELCGGMWEVQKERMSRGMSASVTKRRGQFRGESGTLGSICKEFETTTTDSGMSTFTLLSTEQFSYSLVFFRQLPAPTIPVHFSLDLACTFKLFCSVLVYRCSED